MARRLRRRRGASTDAAAIGELFAPTPSTGTTRPTSRSSAATPSSPRGSTNPTSPARWDAWYEPFAVEGDRGVATGVSTYFDADGTPDRVYDNVFVMEFDTQGRCTIFTEWFRQRPERRG